MFDWLRVLWKRDKILTATEIRARWEVVDLLIGQEEDRARRQLAFQVEEAVLRIQCPGYAAFRRKQEEEKE